LGSFLAGIKAGTLAGVLYFGGLAIVNVAVLYAFQQDTLNGLQQTFAQYCTATSVTNSSIAGSVQDCFDSVTSVLIPVIAFLGFFLSLLYAGIFGIYYEKFPGKSPRAKGVTIAFILGLNLVLFGLSGYSFSYTAGVIVELFFIAWTAVYGVFIGGRYKKYTRLVTFESLDDKSLRIMVDGRDMTGKSSTFAATSTHKMRAEVADDASFKEWEPTGDLALEDNRSFETSVEINGDGTIRGIVSKKY